MWLIAASHSINQTPVNYSFKKETFKTLVEELIIWHNSWICQGLIQTNCVNVLSYKWYANVTLFQIWKLISGQMHPLCLTPRREWPDCSVSLLIQLSIKAALFNVWMTEALLTLSHKTRGPSGLDELLARRAGISVLRATLDFILPDLYL